MQWGDPREFSWNSCLCQTHNHYSHGIRKNRSSSLGLFTTPRLAFHEELWAWCVGLLKTVQVYVMNHLNLNIGCRVKGRYLTCERLLRPSPLARARKKMKGSILDQSNHRIYFYKYYIYSVSTSLEIVYRLYPNVSVYFINQLRFCTIKLSISFPDHEGCLPGIILPHEWWI